MGHDVFARWQPNHRLAERPATIFDLHWQGGEERLIATVFYAANVGEDDLSDVLIFESVFAYKVYEENMDESGALTSDAAQLDQPYPYGGRWPYLEAKQSSWLESLASCHGVWAASELKHFVVTTRNMHLHVACLAGTQPVYHSGYC